VGFSIILVLERKLKNMAAIKTWVVTSTVYKGSVESEEETSIEAHHLTMEPSGALSFWVVTPDGMQSILIIAYPAGGWNLVKIAKNKPAEEKGG
jgi:hypothetical protein